VKAAVLGSPIAHSLSPVLHRAAYAALGLPWTYEAIDVSRESLGRFLSGLDDQWRGLSLTMPLKYEIFDYLDDVDEIGALTGSVNTVVFDEGRLRGFNTDVGGMVDALRECQAVGTTGSIMGTGATARSAVAAASALGVHHLAVWGRRESAVNEVGRVAAQCKVSWTGVTEPVFDTDYVFNTVPAAAIAVTSGPGYLLDAIYDPWPPPLTACWDSARVATGLDLLVHQAAKQVNLMTQREAPIDAMREALTRAVTFPHPEK
jgi:shikimate dehydrogenase